MYDFVLLGGRNLVGHIDSSSFVPCRCFSVTLVEMGKLSLSLAAVVVWMFPHRIPLDRSVWDSQLGQSPRKGITLDGC